MLIFLKTEINSVMVFGIICQTLPKQRRLLFRLRCRCFFFFFLTFFGWLSRFFNEDLNRFVHIYFSFALEIALCCSLERNGTLICPIFYILYCVFHLGADVRGPTSFLVYQSIIPFFYSIRKYIYKYGIVLKGTNI